MVLRMVLNVEEDQGEKLTALLGDSRAGGGGKQSAQAECCAGRPDAPI